MVSKVLVKDWQVSMSCVTVGPVEIPFRSPETHEE